MKNIPALLAAFLLLFVSSCSTSSTPAVIVVTATAPIETLAQDWTATVSAQNSPTALFLTDTPQFTFTPSLKPTLTFTFTPQVPLVVASMQTNCRSGPGTVYESLGVLDVGQTAEVVGRNAAGDYWIIKNPDNTGQVCWLWGQYATVTGDTSSIVMFDPPPTPTPKFTATPPASFQVSFVNVTNCPANYYAINFLITNDGSMTWESDHVTLMDTDTTETQEVSRDNFPRADGCSTVSADLNLEPGEVGYTYYALVGNPTGHNLKVDIRVCSQDGETGICMAKALEFTL